MNWMQFVSSLVSSLAWPSATILILYLFRKELTERLPALMKLKLPGGIEAEFNKDLSTVVASVESAVSSAADAIPVVVETENAVVPAAFPTPIPDPTPNGTIDLSSFMTAEADLVALRANPTGVIMEAWKTLEAVLRLASRRANKNVHLADKISFFSLVKYLSNLPFLTEEEKINLLRLKSMRDLAAHSQEPISAESANSFADVCVRLAGIFEARIQQKFPSSY